MDHLTTFINLLSKQNLIKLLTYYKQCNEQDNWHQLHFLFEQSQKNNASSLELQTLATRCIATKKWSAHFSKQLKTADLLVFFTPALQLDDNFSLVDQQQRNVLHYVFHNCFGAQGSLQPPFVYLRSMMLFESNQTLINALGQRDKHHFTPFDIYLGANRQLAPLTPQEFTAALALIEIQNKLIPQLDNNLNAIMKSVQKLCQTHTIEPNEQLHRIQLIATHYKRPIKKVLKML